MLGKRHWTLVAIVACGCSVRNPAFETSGEGSEAEETQESADEAADGGEETEETGTLDEGGTGRCDGDEAISREFNLVSSTFIRQDSAPSCSPYGNDVIIGASCGVVDFGAYVEHPVYGMESVGLPLWDSRPEAAHLLLQFNDAELRPPDGGDPQYDRFEATLSIPVLATDPSVTGTLEVLLMKFGPEHGWLAGMGDGVTPPQQGVSVFEYRHYDNQNWFNDDPLDDAFPAPLLTVPLDDLPSNTPTVIEADLKPDLLDGYYVVPIAGQNGLLISSTTQGQGLVIDTSGIQYTVSACRI